MKLNRREFLGFSAALAAVVGTGLSGCGPQKKADEGLQKADGAEPSTSDSPKTQVRTICGNCHNNCGVIATIQDGVVIGLEGDPDHPFNKGSLCPKGQAFIDVLYSPDRLQYPMKRVGERGSGEWERVSWDDAYAFINEKLTEVASKYGAQTLLYTNGAPVQNIVRNAFVELYARYGTINMVGAPNLCFVPRLTALKPTYGFRDEDDYNHTDLILCWGGNPCASLRPGSYMCYDKKGNCSPILDARKRGVPLIVIDPVYSETAAKASQWIAPRVATDGAMALAMMNVIIEEDLYDHDFVENWTSGFDQLAALCSTCTPEWAEAICGVSASTIAELARLYATTEKATLHEGNSFALHSNGVQMTRAVGCLRAITGHLDKEGTNVCFPNVVGYPKPVEIGNPSGMKTTVQPDATSVNAGRYPMFLNGLPGALDAIENGVPYTPRALMGYHTNTIMAQGGYDRNKDLLKRLDFICYTELFFTETCEQIADIVLPDACWLERYDYRTYPSENGTVVALRQPVVELSYDRKNSYDMEYELAQIMGLGDDYPWSSQEEFIDYALSPSGLKLEDLKKNPVQTVGTHEYKKYETGGLRADGQPGFDTANGKVMLYCVPFEKNGYDPLPTYTPAFGTPEGSPDVAKKYPLVGTNRRTVHFVHFKYHNNPYLLENHSLPEVNLNPADVKSRGLTPGEWVKVLSPQGETQFMLRADERVQQGVAWIDGGWGNAWDYPDSNMNRLVDNVARDPISQAPDISSFLCEVSAL